MKVASGFFFLAFYLTSAMCQHLPTHSKQAQVRRNPSASADPRVEQAQRLVRDNRKPEAEDLLREILERSPNSNEANILLGNLLIEQQQFEEAEQHFEAVLMLNLHDEAARVGERKAAIGLALQDRRAGNGEASLQSLEHARTFLYDDPVILTDLGVAADALHDYERAGDALEAALKYKPNDPTALYGLARTESDRERPQKAEALFRSYLALRPNDASAHYGLGRLFQRQQRTDEAAVEFRRSIALQPIQTESYFQLGQMALDAHRDEDARAMFDKTLSRLPSHGGARTGLGILEFRAGDFQSARNSLEQTIASSPDYEPAHYYLGLTLARLGDKAASKLELAKAAELAKQQQDKGKPIEGIAPASPAGP